MDWRILEPGNYFSASCHLWLPHRRIGIEREHLDHTEDQGRLDLLAKRIFYREQLYPDSISEGAHAMADAIQHNLQNPNNLTPVHALLSCMCQSSSTDVLESAERVIQHIINTYSEPNLNSRINSVQGSQARDPCDEFSDICRAGLEAMHSQLQ